MSGILYVLATPIGNLKDITLRGIEVLGEVDFVVAENRERALKLLSHLSLRKPIISINSFNEERRAKNIVQHLLEGESYVLITGAGTPCISDPGTTLVKECHEAGIEVRALPGPSAAVAAVSVSGLYADRFLFYGFLPQRKGKKTRALREIAQQMPYPVILFESPRRLRETMEVIQEVFGDITVVIVKEMTKVFEKVLRGKVGDLLPDITKVDVKGEYTIIIDGRAKPEK